VRDAYGVTLDNLHVRWDDMHSRGHVPPTWVLADRLRSDGAQGILTASFSRPDLTHLTLFDWNTQSGALVAPDPTLPAHPL